MSQNMNKSIFVVNRKNESLGFIKATEMNRVLMLDGKDLLIADDIASRLKSILFLMNL